MEYTAHASADGNGRNGRVSTPDGLIDLALTIPPELGGAGGGSNPEQLFAAGYSGCFMSALGSSAREGKIKLIEPSVSAAVTIAHGDDGFGLFVELTVSLPGLSADHAHELIRAAHRRCPYSKALRGNVPVSIRLAIETEDTAQAVVGS